MFDAHILIRIAGIPLLMVVLVMCSSCDGEKRQVKVSDKQIEESLIQSNKIRARKEAGEIADFITKKGWEMTSTGTGLYYMVYEAGNGIDYSKNGQEATVHYSIHLFSDTLCYTSRESDPATFKIGLSGVESGLHEGLTYMKEGDKAKFIIPSHLAYGTFGDRNKIPPHTPLVYDIELIKLN